METTTSLLPRVQPAMLAAKARAIFENEMVKGCTPDISCSPVELEPPFFSLTTFRDLFADTRQEMHTAIRPPSREELLRLKVWITPGETCDWLRNELFVKQLQAIRHRLCFEISGNRIGVAFSFLVHAEDEGVLESAFKGEFPDHDLSREANHVLDAFDLASWQDAVFEEYLTPPPYSHLLTRSSELQLSPLEPFLNSLVSLLPPATGVYQLVVQPVSSDHNWHRNVEIMTDLEYIARLYGGHQAQQRYAQQAPSGQLNSMAHDVENKSHSDKPFFCAVTRVSLLGAQNGVAEQMLRALTTVIRLFLHGGRPLQAVSHRSFREYLTTEQLRDMFRLGVTHRAGSLLNSAECCGLMHIPPLQSWVNRGLAVSTSSPIPIDADVRLPGLYLGDAVFGEKEYPIHTADAFGELSIHAIGRPKMGKSYEVASLCRQVIGRGHGIALLDPHGDCAELVLGLLREDDLDRVIYFDAGHPEYVPLWSPLAKVPGQQADRLADELIRTFTQISTGWGDRLETLLRQAFYALTLVGDCNLLDVALLLSPSSELRHTMPKRILEVINNEKARHFWKEEFSGYTKRELWPVQSKLTKLLLHDTLGLALSQPENRFNIRQIMDSGKIFIANLSTIGPDARDIVGKIILSLIHLAALSRSGSKPNDRKPFLTFVDESHRFATDVLEDMIAESRKYSAGLCFAHQYLSQYEKRRHADALGIVGTTVAFNVSVEDAPRIAKFLGPGVDPTDLTSLKEREAMVRVGNRVFRIRTPDIGRSRSESIADEAKRRSFDRYYGKAEDLRRERDRRGSRAPKGFVERSAMPRSRIVLKEFAYDEFP